MGEAFSSTKRTVSLSLTKHKHKQPFVDIDIYVRTPQVKSKVQMITVCTSNIFPQNDLARGSFPYNRKNKTIISLKSQEIINSQKVTQD
jgi:hypothetical protein